MEVQDFPSCCGAKVLTGFGYTDTAAVRQDHSLSAIDRFITAELNRLNRNHIAMALATINGEQKKVLGKLFKKHGFRTVSKAYHPNHGSTIYLMVKNFKHKK